MKTSTLCIFLILLAWATGTGHLAWPVSAQGACRNMYFVVLFRLIPCMPSVVSFAPAPPSEECCSAVKNVTQPCFCDLTNGPPINGVDRNVALTLPVQCSLNFDPCNFSFLTVYGFSTALKFSLNLLTWDCCRQTIMYLISISSFWRKRLLVDVNV